MQRDTKQSEQSVPYTCLEDRLLEQLKDIIIKLVPETLRTVLQLDIVVQKEMEGHVVSANVRNIIKDMLRPVVLSTFEDWERSRARAKDLPAQDLIRYRVRLVRLQFQVIHQKSIKMVIDELVQQGIQNITTINRPLPIIRIMNYLNTEVFQKIKEVDIIDEIELYKT